MMDLDTHADNTVLGGSCLLICYKRLRHDVFTDTMQSKTKSRRGELYSQVYTTGFHWCRAHPMKLKSDAHDSLSLLYQRDGVPPKMIMVAPGTNPGPIKKEVQGC
jgi:hypothetical protein